MAARRGFAGVCRTYLAQGSFLLAKNELGEQPADVARGPAALLKKSNDLLSQLRKPGLGGTLGRTRGR